MPRWQELEAAARGIIKAAKDAELGKSKLVHGTEQKHGRRGCSI